MYFSVQAPKEYLLTFPQGYYHLFIVKKSFRNAVKEQGSFMLDATVNNNNNNKIQPLLGAYIRQCF